MPKKRRRHQRGWWLEVTLLTLLLPVGIAHMAQSTVDPSFADQNRVTISIATSVELGNAKIAKVNRAQEDGKDYYKFQQLRATLTHAGGPVQGVLLKFVVAGRIVCEERTDGDGQVMCDNNAMHPVELFGPTVPTAYTVSFAGEGALEPSSRVGALRPIGDGMAGADPTESTDIAA